MHRNRNGWRIDIDGQLSFGENQIIVNEPIIITLNDIFHSETKGMKQKRHSIATGNIEYHLLIPI